MQLSINELAELFGLTAESIRFYEKKGILTPHRAPNGYRYFSDEEMADLTECRRYSGYGFSLQNIANLFLSADEQEVLDALRKIVPEQRQEIRWKDAFISHLERTLRTLDLMPLRGDDLYAKKFPEQLGIIIDKNWDSKGEIQTVRVLSRGNLNKMIPLTDVKRIYPYDGERLGEWNSTGYFFETQYTGLLELPKDVDVQIFPGRSCFCKMVKVSSINELPEQIQSCLTQVKAKGWQISGHIFTNTLIRVRDGNTHIRYTEIEIPVDPKA